MSSDPSTSNTAEVAQIVQPAEEQVTYKVFRPPQSERPLAHPPELPESYFEPTAADLQLAQAQLSSRVQALTDAPLKTRALRDVEEKAKRDRWPTTRIRVRFPDQTMLEKTFPSTDRIKAVYVFVRACLRDDVKSHKFILYEPPRRDLKNSDPKVRDLSLFDLKLTPSAVLMLRFDIPDLDRPTYPAPLLPSVLTHAEDLPPPPNFDGDSSNTSSSSTPKPNPSTSTLLQGAEKKVPKWFKMGAKK